GGNVGGHSPDRGKQAPPRSNLPATLEDLLPPALDSFREQYRDLAESWRHMDTKAQGAGAIAGVFLAAALAWAKDLPTDFTVPQKIALVGCVVLLILAVISAVTALHVRNVSSPPPRINDVRDGVGHD